MTTVDAGEVAAIVSFLSMGLAYLGITGVDSTSLNAAVNGVFAIIGLGASVYSWWSHRQKNTQA